MDRAAMMDAARGRSAPWDMVVIGGGATGAGIAVDAANRGLDVLLVEREDFGKGTSSRSTKLVHGGVRYLEQGNISLVMEALKERGILRQNAPHLVHDLAFVVPNYSWWEAPFYGIGMKVYDLLAGKYGFGKSKVLSREETLARLPTIQTEGLRGGVMYYDGQFDDSRLLIHLMMTAAENGAVLLNYCEASAISKGADGFVNGITVLDRETGTSFAAPAKVVVNATGIFTDETRRLIEPEANTMIAPSQGIHLVFDKSFLEGDTAIMVPHTSDGRVMFAIPWHEHTLVGTTDTPIDGPSYDPLPFEQEIEFVLETAGLYLSHAPTRADILCVYTGIRPLVKAGSAAGKALARDHTIHVDGSGLLTIVGGKWTTYRKMAEDCVDHAIMLGDLPEAECRTQTLSIHGYTEDVDELSSLGVYGSDAAGIEALIKADRELVRQLHPALPYQAAEVVWAVRKEMARTLDDVLGRRLRALFLNTEAALAMAPEVARLMAREMGKGEAWIEQQLAEFRLIAEAYSPQRQGIGNSH
jgi:glycerol-3-phosphate dehydrogenase